MNIIGGIVPTHTFTKKDFPLILANTPPDHNGRFMKSINRLNKALANKDGLIDSELKVIIDGINDGLEKSYELFIRQRYYYSGNWRNNPTELEFIDDISPELHRALGGLLNLNHTTSYDPLCKDAIAFLNEVSPIVVAIQPLHLYLSTKQRTGVLL